jgi:Pilus formation protein N terminal region
MSAVLGRRRRLFRVWAWTVIFAATLCAQAQADTITVNVDQAQVLKLPEKVATVVIGNPLIADAALQSGGIMVVTGKGYGSTNLLALDRGGRVIMDKTIEVLGPTGQNLVVVYKGVERESYSCAPECKPRITLGDSQNFFNGALGQTSARIGGAQAAAPVK